VKINLCSDYLQKFEVPEFVVAPHAGATFHETRFEDMARTWVLTTTVPQEHEIESDACLGSEIMPLEFQVVVWEEI